MENPGLAPIVLFVYNRPKHTELTLNALTENSLAKESILYIFSDGPKEGAKKKTCNDINEVRKIIRSKLWCKKVIIIESDTNQGLATSIKQGVSEILKKHGKAIVLEDDLLTSNAFLIFMNKALTYYENRKSVFSISGYSLPPTLLTIPNDYKYDVYVSLRNSSWGWGTWEDRWSLVDWKLERFNSVFKNLQIQEALSRMGDDLLITLKKQQEKQLDVWAVYFVLSHFINHAISITPTFSYVNNIGLDGTGANCSDVSCYRNDILNNKKDINFIDVLYQDKRIINGICSAYSNLKRPVWQKIFNRISRILGGENIFILKKKVFYE